VFHSILYEYFICLSRIFVANYPKGASASPPPCLSRVPDGLMHSVSFAHSAAAGGAGASCHLALQFLTHPVPIRVPFLTHLIDFGAILAPF
jgi:hypothetical protein